MKSRPLAVVCHSWAEIVVATLFLLLAGCGSSNYSYLPSPPKGDVPCALCALYVAEENQKPGTTDWLPHNTANNGEIEGYAGAVSLNRGGSITFFITTASPSYTLQIFRLGWYAGDGGRSMTDPVTLPGQVQPPPIVDAATGLLECPWNPSYTLTVPIDSSDPTNWLSGVYVAKLTTSDSGKERLITFVVRDDSSTSAILFNSGAATYEAYNNWGGKSLYAYNSTNGVSAVKASFDRPFVTYDGGGYFFQFEYNAVRFMERNGYDVTYTTDVDLHQPMAATILPQHKMFVAMNHNEYWSRAMRDNLQFARDQGVNIAFFTGNVMEWQIRYEPSTLTKVADRTVVEYRYASLDPDDENPGTWNIVTTEWRNPPVNDPEQLLVGEMYSSVVTPNVADYVVNDASSWVFTGTGLTNGSHIPMVVGREIDHVFPGFGGPGARVLATGPIVNQAGALDYANMTVYQAASGAYVFEAGSLMFPWTVDSWTNGEHPDYRNAVAEQITQNVLAQFGALPQNP